jgi:hypothetical protein
MGCMEDILARRRRHYASWIVAFPKSSPGRMPTLEELVERKPLAECTWRGTVEDYKHDWGQNMPPVGTHLAGSNEIIQVRKDGFRDLGKEGPKRSHGTLFSVTFSCRELSDSEWGWRH